MTTRRVLQLMSSGGYYGAENMAMQLSLALRRLNHEPIIGVFRNAHRPNTELIEEARRRGFQVEMIDCKGKIDFRAISTIRNCILQNQIDVVHSHGYKADIYACLAVRGTNTTLVATCHNWPGKALALKLYAMLDRFFLRRFPAIAAVSTVVRDALVRSGVPNERIRLVQNGIDTESFSKGQPILKQLPQLQGKKVVGFVGRLAEEKGLAYLMLAAQSIVREDRNVAFVFAGEGAYRDGLCNLAKRLDLENHVVLLGKRSDLADVYASLDVLVLPSLSEGVPMVVLEAMAAGKPVLATRVGGIPQVIEDERTGLLVEPADAAQLTIALKRLLASPGLCEQLGQRGRDRVLAHYSARSMAEVYLTMYREIEAQKPAVPKAATPESAPNNVLDLLAVNHPQISVIIPTLNEESVIGRCLDSLDKNNFPKSAFEVIVVDNGSTDRTIDVAKSFESILSVKVFKLEKVHISALRNLGAAEARGRFLAFLDADCLAPENWLASALRRLEDSDAGIVGAHYGIPDDSTWVGRLWTQDRFAEKTGDVSYVPAGDLLLNREMFFSVGCFDESIQTNEDFELCERARGLGLSVRSYPDLQVTHLGTPRTLLAFYRKQRWHGTHVFTIFLRDSRKRKNLRTILFSLYTLFCIIGIPLALIGQLMGMSWKFATFFALGLVLPCFLIALKGSATRKDWSQIFPLTVLYLTFGIARANSLVQYRK
jgi:glycosyltransferase involved in cell wall biosynthesis